MKANAREYTDRRLRGLVADLASRRLDDIEAIWRALSEGERDKLRPLLEEAASLLPDAKQEFASVLALTPPAGDRPDRSGQPPVAVERLIGHWPDSLLVRLLGSLDNDQRMRCLAARPEWRQHPTSTLAPRASEALMRAAADAVLALPLDVADRNTPSVAPKTWAQRLSNPFRRSRG
ncbi:hypothetical protein [Burkholderia stagnalis]|uniref:hypothetical protein n=1 Tax=Burkholderia stagnalis TaxID=1503054 RepID=UPI000F5BD72C|nr:hypothetical protein [Burkholderia stagnalis]